MGSCSLTRAGAATQDGQGPEWGRLLRGAAADVQGLLQADGHQQGWPAGQERPARRLRQRRCAHERVRARRSPRRDLRTLHLRQHGQDVPGEDGWRGQRPRRPHRAGLQGLRQRGQDRLQDVRARPQDLGDKMTKAEIDDIFGEFEIDEDYMIKTKDVIGLFVAVKEEPKVEEPAPVEEAPEAEPEEDADAKKKKKKKKKAAK